MLGAEQASEDSPKRRSTFYVSLEHEPRQSSSSSSSSSAKSFQKSASCDTERYACNTFPISTSKTAPNVPLLTRTQSTSNDCGYHAAGGVGKPGMLGPRGKVQSLTRIFEAPKHNNNNLNNNNNNNVSMANKAAVTESEQRKKVERTRSFKTIERFQNRFVGKKETSSSGHKDSRLNKTTGSVEPEKSGQDTESRRRSRHEDAAQVERRASQSRTASSANSKTRTRDHAKSVVEQRTTGSTTKQSQSVSGPSLANLLIRRTHSTKLARSTSTIIGRTGPGRQTSSGDDGCNLAQAKQREDETTDSGQENDDGMLLARRYEETDTDNGVHSGDYASELYAWK